MAAILQVFCWSFHEFLGKEDTNWVWDRRRKVRGGDGMGDLKVLAGLGSNAVRLDNRIVNVS